MERDGGIWAVLGGLYRGAVDPADWSHALDGLTRLFKGELSVVEIRQRRRPDVMIESSSVTLPEPVQHQYNVYYGRICPRAALLRDPAPRLIMHDDMVGDEAELDRDEYHADFLTPQGLRYFVACRLSGLADTDIVLSVQRARAAGRASAEEIARFEQLVPHLADAYALRLAFGAAQAWARLFDAALDRIGAAAILVGGDGRVRYVSRAAERMIGKAEGIALGPAGLAIEAPAARRAFERLLGRVLAGSGAPGGTLAVASLRLRVVPLDPDANGVAGSAAAILLEHEPHGAGAEDALTRHGLTPRERDIALLLADGWSPREIAETRGLGLSTVRTHIARARTKLDTRSIAGLVRSVLKERPN